MKQLFAKLNETLKNNSETNSNLSESYNNNNSNSHNYIDWNILAIILSIVLIIMFSTVINTCRLRQRAIHDNLMLEVESVDSGYADIEYEDIDEEINEGARILDVDDSVERRVNERVTVNVYAQVDSEEEVVVRIY
ncbi:hypothetical protein PGAL8A_00065800 [Plasmodium gallinaceum]|uniref:Uncharacterized protein n=1 Tax=Plasmodium gallinaceum TaxID=5849 RepID=A0A1J1GW46_PLAGA|nr:hypothetical protein PGAL8A_00272400 [Plasmodium gallinaceum]XP_028531018.1 hypothetical protein PGAL8A_00065800 [Plasmodium gallinaceum]CRG95524.1 hypothetical protein PGAL8A_00272400 [Plasmodium gallinaceum]CRG98221.1 hypothetical protein PGAL8A_00065800 [Plasmodium gallinaceum]